MAFQGLFVGIDQYASDEINELSCARRDATALHALFMDTFGGEGGLLTDAEATVPAIQAAFERLARAAEDDVVVVAFCTYSSSKDGTLSLLGDACAKYAALSRCICTVVFRMARLAVATAVVARVQSRLARAALKPQ